MIDWKSRINPKHIVFFKQYKEQIEKKYKRDIKELELDLQSGKFPVSDFEERFLLVKLAGWRELAMQRGYSNVIYNIATATPDYTCVQCIISWLPYKEEVIKFRKPDEIYAPEYNEVCPAQTFSAIADAHRNNTDLFFSNYLSTLAENRSFCRAVRNYLNISIVSYDEIGPDAKEENKRELVIAEPQFKLLPETVKEVLNMDNVKDFKSYLRGEYKKKPDLLDEGDLEALKHITEFSEFPPLLATKLVGYLKSGR